MDHWLQLWDISLGSEDSGGCFLDLRSSHLEILIQLVGALDKLLSFAFENIDSGALSHAFMLDFAQLLSVLEDSLLMLWSKVVLFGDALL